MIIPVAVEAALLDAAKARRAWMAAPIDRDHAVRHAAADEARNARHRLLVAVDEWVDDLAEA